MKNNNGIIGYGSVIAAAFFLVTPNISLFDFAPDFCSSNTVFRINTLALAFPGFVLWQIIKAFARIVIGIVRERVRENLANMNNTQETNA